ncbi:hypothetical protein B296_00027318 [Ensete ventricosum]|uniref:Uncharacterized protein n=1 Tax=Ensete ventricosum TaxID=4639 RepID=A0A426YNP6_ENSVE|nr:hypothetical protein B296_00027318 [Ensete ventricosum]
MCDSRVGGRRLWVDFKTCWVIDYPRAVVHPWRKRRMMTVSTMGVGGRRQQLIVKDAKGGRLLRQGRQRRGWAATRQRRKKVVVRRWSSGRGGCGWKDVATVVVKEEREMVADD